MSIPEFRAFKFDPVNIKGKQLIPVVVETHQSEEPDKTFATSCDNNQLAQPRFYPTVKFNNWFESVIALNPKPLEINSTRNDGDFRYSSHTKYKKSYDCAFVKESALNEAKIEGFYQPGDLITSNINIQNSEQLNNEEKKVFMSEIKKAYEYLSAKKTIIIENILTRSSYFINLFEGETKTIGREELCRDDQSISKEHITLQSDGGKIYLKDVSKFGLKMNNSQIPRHQFYELENESEIETDNFKFRIKIS